MILLFILLIAFAALVSPIVTIWALNLLFGLGIPTTVWTWLAIHWLTLVLHSASRSGGSSK